MNEPSSVTPRWRFALHLLWTVPLAVLLSFFPVLVASFTACTGIPCWPRDMQYDQIPVLCGLAGLLVFLAIQLVPWARRPGLRLLVSTPLGLAWAVYWLLTSLRVFRWGWYFLLVELGFVEYPPPDLPLVETSEPPPADLSDLPSVDLTE